MGRSILVVDDSSVMRMFIRNYLASEPGLDIREAANGEEAVRAYRESAPDMVFLDLTMPVMDGTTALGLIREMDPAAWVVVVTADVQSKSIERVMQMGAVSVLKKPPMKEQVLQAYRDFELRFEGRS
jgi:two-component system chemotaxis response regulator CheY